MALRYIAQCSLLSSLAYMAMAHDGHQQEPMQETTDWATKHMAEEHHIGNFDPGAFFSLHDYDSSGAWTADEILRTYGLEDESQKDLPKEKRDKVVNDVMKLLDADEDGQVTQAEWMQFNKNGGKLPDFGLGPGHHGDDEYEYEIHHFEKYHDENTREEDLTHPEDIAHFKKHDQEADEEEKQEKLDRMPIVEQNIPQKFRRNP
ncbi:MAG: hypothetical protein M1812_001947 [Candelaria pacifica]|nr:MAG: hypothetical protein M1812_001947 [Candelaria pacifica]